jgi:hypothetical protein
MILLCATNMLAHSFDALAITTIASTAYDLQSTFNALERCNTCREGNPAMRPFIGNKPAAYGIVLGLTGSTIYASHKLKQQNKRWWWIPMVAISGLHIGAAIHNGAGHGH